MGYLFRNRMRIVLFVFASLGASVFNSMPLLVIRQFLGVVLQKGDPWDLYVIAAVLGACWLFRGYFTARREVASEYLSRRVTMDLVNETAGALMRRPLAYFSRTRTGDLISRIMTDAQAAGELVFLLLQLFKEPLTVVMIVAAVAYMNWKLALIGFVGFPLAVYPLFLLGRRIARSSRKARELTAELADSMVQLFSGIKVVKAFQMEDAALANFRNTTGGMFHHNMKQVRAAAMSHPIVELVNGIGVVLVILAGGTMVLRGSMDADELVVFIIAFLALHHPARTIGNAYNRLKYVAPGLERTFEILDSSTGDIDDGRSGATPEPLAGDITLSKVSFTYGREEVLHDIDLEIKAGEVTALVGPTGAGKTTLLDLIAGFYGPSAGTILWDGRQIAAFDRKLFLRQVSYAPQEPVLFNVSIRENVRQGRPDASDDEIREVCILAGVHDDITGFASGYDTPAGEAGGGLSGGQKQRIALARALLKKNASLFVFDEPTSSLDVQTELNLWAKVREYLSGKTIVLVAHRLTLVRNADTLAVVSGGAIESVGRHADLLDSSPVYSNLWKLHGSVS